MQMHETAFIISVALLAGVICQVIAQHLRLPSIVLLLAAGILLGPDVAGLVQPAAIGGGMQALVGYAVAIILFEGGMNLSIHRLRRESQVIQSLITLGAIVTAIGTTVVTRLIMGWSWSISMLFGTLVIVTGPTVITPLLRRIKIKRSLETILEAEGVLIDPIGAIIALVALEAVIHPPEGALLTSLLYFSMRLGTGVVIGLTGGLIISLVLRPPRLIPDGFVNVFALSGVLALFHISNVLQPESGIGAVTVAGLTVANFCNRVLRELMEFKEQLTLLLIGMLFVLLAADVRIEEIQQLGWPGVLTVVAIIVIVRPLNIFTSTVRSNLPLNEKVFLSWLAPRGIVAAAIASLFAISLADAGIPGGTELRAMVFLVIGMTVVIQGLTGAMVARWTGVKRETGSGYGILGANDLGRLLGKTLQEGGQRVVLVDSNADAANIAEAEGLKVIYGNAFEDSIAYRAGLEDMAACIGLTSNEEVNFLFARRARRVLRVSLHYVALHDGKGHVTADMIHKEDSLVLFGYNRDIDLWIMRVRRKLVSLEIWRCSEDITVQTITEFENDEVFNKSMLPLAYTRENKIRPVDHKTRFRKDRLFYFLVLNERHNDAIAWLQEHDFEIYRPPDPSEPKKTTS